MERDNERNVCEACMSSAQHAESSQRSGGGTADDTADVTSVSLIIPHDACNKADTEY